MAEPEFDERLALARVHELFARAPHVTALGLSVVRVAAGLCESVLVVRPEHAQQNGFVHAGVTATMGDHTAGGAAATIAPESCGVLTTEYSIHLLRPARGKELRCVATVLRPGRTLSVVEAEIVADGTLVAKLTATLAIVPADG